MVDSQAQHVIPAEGGWAVRKVGSSRATKTFRTQADAIKAARETAKRRRSVVYVHGRDGKIRLRDSYQGGDESLGVDRLHMT